MAWILLIFFGLAIAFAAVVLDSHLGRALADYVSKRGGTPLDEGVANRRLAALESEVERLNGEIMRLEEETVFLHRLLESKPPARGEIPPGAGAS
jgi:hypothetical protein